MPPPISDDFSGSPLGGRVSAKSLDISAADGFVSDDFLALRNALYILSVHHMADRLDFAARWPAVADYIFGAELLSYDHHGTPDKIRRAWLENKAEEGRLEFIELCNALEERSVAGGDAGLLDMAYVSGVIEAVGYEVALHLYDQQIVDHILPPPETAKDYGQIEGSVREVSPETMFMPMLSAQRVTDTEMVKTPPKNEPPEEAVDPLAPFKQTALPSAAALSRVDHIVIPQASLPSRKGLRTSWAHLMYRYEDENPDD